MMMNVFGLMGSCGRADSGFSATMMSASGKRSGLANSSRSSVTNTLNPRLAARGAIALETWPPPHSTICGGVVYASTKNSGPSRMVTNSFLPWTMRSRALLTASRVHLGRAQRALGRAVLADEEARTQPPDPVSRSRHRRQRDRGTARVCGVDLAGVVQVAPGLVHRGRSGSTSCRRRPARPRRPGPRSARSRGTGRSRRDASAPSPRTRCRPRRSRRPASRRRSRRPAPAASRPASAASSPWCAPP